MTSRIVLLFAVLTATATEVRGQFESPAAVALRVVSIGSVMSGEGPMWAADGRHVLFTSNTGGPSLWRVPVAGGSPERVAGPVSSGNAACDPHSAQEPS